MLFHFGPEAIIVLDLDLFTGIKLVEATKVHWLVEQRHDVSVKGLPVWVLKMVSSNALMSQFVRERRQSILLRALVSITLHDCE